MIAIIIGLTIGFGLPIQTTINSKLRDAFGSPFLSSLISFIIGTIFLAIVVVASGQGLIVGMTTISSQPWWLWLGGVFGVIYLTSNILLFPKIGSVQTVIFPVLGQILMGLLIDNGGWFSSAVQRLTVSRGLGALLVLIGVIVTVALPNYLESRKALVDVQAKADVQGSGKDGLNSWLWRLWGVFAGMLSASQTAINGHLGIVVGSAIKSAFISFLIGTVLLIIIVLIMRPKVRYKETADQHRWWMWIGGVIGSLYVLGNAYLAPTIGTGLAVVIVLIGLMAGSLLIDQFGWLDAKRNPITPIQLVGLLMMILGVVVIRLI